MRSSLELLIRRVVHAVMMMGISGTVTAKDHLLTIGGGYSPTGNQASLEANVIFYQQLVSQSYSTPVEHLIYFADGTDPKDDLQVMAAESNTESPAIELLEGIFSADGPQVTYRNHEIPNITDKIRPAAIQTGLEQIASHVVGGDRLIIYVTAHGGSAKGDDPMDTSITCWGKQPISMRQFTEWLDEIPSDVSVVMVMAQCYCGGFANTMFSGGDPKNGMSKGNRVGFFAQRHDLPAAGCRPDITNDDEYSSYFWGAFLGQSRTGKPVGIVDNDQNNRVSFSEAHAYAVVASPTVDIPLRTSDVYLRAHSRIAGHREGAAASPSAENSGKDVELGLSSLSGSLSNLAVQASLDQRVMINGLLTQLKLPFDIEVAEILNQKEIQEERFRQARREAGRRGSSRRESRSSGRRDLQQQIIQNWPELQEADDWDDLESLTGRRGEGFLDELRDLPAFETYWTSKVERSRAQEKSVYAELKAVQFRRLVHTIESVVFAKNLPVIASPEILKRYTEMLTLESSFFGS